VTASTAAAADDIVDVAVIGAGVVGCAIARQVGRSQRSCVLIEARNDVGDVTSKANTAILHTGFDAPPGSLEAQLVRDGHRLLRSYAETTGIPIERTGAVVVAWNAEQEAELPTLLSKAHVNSYAAADLISANELYRREPHLAPGAKGALLIPDESVICPWTTTLAYATEAVTAGVRLRLNTTVQGVTQGDDGTHAIATNNGLIRARWLINAAGLGSDLVDRMFGHDGFTITPRRGQLVVFDKLARNLVSAIILPIPTGTTKGVLVSPTIYGNLLVGPTAEDLADRSDTATTKDGLMALVAAGEAIVPTLSGEEVTSTYAGLRAATEHRDYQIRCDARMHYVCVGGIRSTGLSASLGIADHVAGLLADAGLPLTERADAPPPPRMPNLGEASDRPATSPSTIAADPEYGRIVCFCERVSRGELRDALAGPIPPPDRSGLARRTRATNGRCQGFYCAAEVASILRESS
jgi:glycerol-3-phosphate dehydrogenase